MRLCVSNCTAGWETMMPTCPQKHPFSHRRVWHPRTRLLIPRPEQPHTVVMRLQELKTSWRKNTHCVSIAFPGSSSEWCPDPEELWELITDPACTRASGWGCPSGRGAGNTPGTAGGWRGCAGNRPLSPAPSCVFPQANVAASPRE